MEDESKSKDKIFTGSFIFIIIITLLFLLSIFVIFFLIANNRNSSILYQNEISKLKNEILDLSKRQLYTCPKPEPVDCGAATSLLVEETPVECSLFTYSNWSVCSSKGIQTRTVTSQAPSGCTGGTPYLTQSCVPPVISCVSFTYSNWGTCSNGTQTRTVTSQAPLGCTGGSPYLTQSCTPPVISCASFTYSNWSTCSGGMQTRTVTSQAPAGCTGGSTTLTQSCTPPAAPFADIKADGQDGTLIIYTPRNVNFSWASANVTSCQATGSYNSGSGSGQTLNGSINYYVDEPINITFTCVGPGGSVSDSIAVSLVQ